MDVKDNTKVVFTQEEDSKLSGEIESIESRLECILEDFRKQMKVEIQVRLSWLIFSKTS